MKRAKTNTEPEKATVQNIIPGLPGVMRDRLRPFLEQRSRAEQIAATLPGKLKDLGQLPDPKPEKPAQEQETPEQLARRTELKAKLRSFAE